MLGTLAKGAALMAGAYIVIYSLIVILSYAIQPLI